ncbi:MAG: hypothetical protein ACFE7R_11225, partial [Candidatus Hodarchaeota archaeon]
LSWSERVRISLALVRWGSIDLTKELYSSVFANDVWSQGVIQESDISPVLWGYLQIYSHSCEDGALDNIWPKITKGIGLLADFTDELLLRTSQSEETISSLPLHSYSPRHLEKQEEFLLGVDDIISATNEVRDEEDEPETPDTPTLEPEEWTTTLIMDAMWALAAINQVLTLRGDSEFDKREKLEGLSEKLISAIMKTTAKMSTINELFASPEDSSLALCLVSTESLLRTQVVDESLLEKAIEAITNNLMHRHLIRVPQIKGRFSSHLALRIGQYYVNKNRKTEVEKCLQRILELVSENNCIPEYVDQRTGGGSYGAGASVFAAADLLLLMRDMLLMEEGDVLRVLPAIPNDWFASSTQMTADNLPTIYGPLGIEIGQSANQHQIEVHMTELPQELSIYVPTSFALPMMKIFGGGIVGRIKDPVAPFIKVLPLSPNIIATIHR